MNLRDEANLAAKMKFRQKFRILYPTTKKVYDVLTVWTWRHI